MDKQVTIFILVVAYEPITLIYIDPPEDQYERLGIELKKRYPEPEKGEYIGRRI